MLPLAAKCSFLGCWLIANLAAGAPEYSDDHAGSFVSTQATGLSSSVTDACKVEATKTVFVTLSPDSQQSTVSIPAGANVETTTIIVSPVQSHAKTDATVEAATTGTNAAPEPTTSFSSNLETNTASSDVSSLEYSTVSRTKVTIVSTHTVTFTIAPASKDHFSTTSAPVSVGESTEVSSAGGISASGSTTCITRTVLGPDGRATVVESIFVTASPTETTLAQASRVLGTATSPVSGQVTAPGLPVPAYSNSPLSGLQVHTSFTVIGSGGVTSVVDTTWIIPIPPTSVMSGLGPIPTAAISSGRLVSGLPSNAASEPHTEAPITSVMGTPTCITVTVIGPDLQPTVSELTIIAPTGAPSMTTSIVAPPSFVAPASMTDLAIQPAVTSNSEVTTITWKVIGADGTVSPIIQTITAPSDSIVAGVPTTLPSAVTVNIPLPPTAQMSQTVPVLPAYGTVSAPASQNPTSVVTLVSGVGSVPSFVPVSSSSEVSPVTTGEPPAYSIDSVIPVTSDRTPIGLPTIGASPIQYSSGSSDAGWVSSILYGSLPTPPFPASPVSATPVISPVLATPVPVSPVPVTPVPETPTQETPAPETPAQETPAQETQVPETPIPVTPLPTTLPNPISPATPEVVKSLATSTWINVIPEKTTTHVVKFPLTTMLTVTIPGGASPGRKLLRRQSSVQTLSPWSNSSTTLSPLTENTSLISSLSSELLTPMETSAPPTVTIPTTSASTSKGPTEQTSPTACATGDKVGNSTVSFDQLLPGPLLNPASDLWFSEGFLIAPPSSPPSNAFMPASGHHQLVEFLPPALVPNVPFDGAGDTAEISIGPNEASPCFRFNFYGASLGCAAEGVEQWCDFEISAYTYNDASHSEISVSWSEIKRVPACPQFPQGPCPLTPVQLDGYHNITSILVTVRVGLELRAWWGDDFQIGWSDNSCEASTCRTNAVPRRVKRDVFSRASRRGVWQWTTHGAKKLDDDYVWSSFE